MTPRPRSGLLRQEAVLGVKKYCSLFNFTGAAKRGNEVIKKKRVIVFVARLFSKVSIVFPYSYILFSSLSPSFLFSSHLFDPHRFFLFPVNTSTLHGPSDRECESAK